MEEQPQEDWLEAQMREEMPYIDDAGFTARVVEQLPARASHRSFRGVILLSITLLACTLSYTLSRGGAFLVSAINDLEKMPPWMVCIIAVFCALLITVVAAGAAFFRERDEILS